MTKHMTEIFKTYVEGINKQTEALESAFNKMVEGGFILEEQQEESEDTSSDLPIDGAPPIVEDIVPEPKRNTYHMSAKLIKDETTYFNASDMKSSKFTPGYGLDEAKESIVSAGRMEICVSQDESFKYTFTIYKNGKSVGVVHPCRDNMDLIAQLEMYVGKTVLVDTAVKREIKGSIFTSLSAVIVGIEEEAPLVASEPFQDTPGVKCLNNVEQVNVLPLDQSNEYQVSTIEINEESSLSLSLGEMSMDSFSLVGGDE